MKTTVQADPYAELIEQFIGEKFPGISDIKGENLVEVLTAIIIGTKEYRYGPVNTPESQVVIRDIIRTSIDADKSIPVLIPWGSMKGDGSSNVDVAEIMAIQRVICVAKQVQTLYTPGLRIVIRIEDLTGMQLFSESPNIVDPFVERTVKDYTDNMVVLMRVLGKELTQPIVPFLETNAAASNNVGKVFYKYVLECLPYFEAYLRDTDHLPEITGEAVKDSVSFGLLKNLGWSGLISREQRDYYYYGTYEHLYGCNRDESITKLALYFSQALARRRYRLHSPFDKFIQITFVQPIPGVPRGYDNNYVYYRTIPISHGRTHVSPWRSKGYLQISGRSVQAKLSSFRSLADKELFPSQTVLQDGMSSVSVSTDYQILN